MDKKTILAIVLSLILVMGYQYFFMKPVPEEKKCFSNRRERGCLSPG